MALFDNIPTPTLADVLNGAGTVLQGAAPYVGAVVAATNPVPYAPAAGTGAPITTPTAPAPSATGTPGNAPTAPVTTPTSTVPVSAKTTKGVVIVAAVLFGLFVAFAPRKVVS